MDLFDQVRTEANRISTRGGYQEGAVSLVVFYAEVLEVVLARIMEMEEHMDKNTYDFLMAPLAGRAGE